MTCKDCIHYEVCKAISWQLPFCNPKECDYFKDKSKYIELPCKVRDKAYLIWNYSEPEIQECEIEKIEIKCSGVYVGLDYVDCIGQHNKAQFLINHLNKTVFLTKSEAEQKLKELQND